MNEHDDQGRPRGLWEERFSDGGLSGTGRNKDGEKNCEWTGWYKNGQQKAHGAYARGKLHGPWVWYRAAGGPLQARILRPRTAGRTLDAAPGSLPEGTDAARQQAGVPIKWSETDSDVAA